MLEEHAPQAARRPDRRRAVTALDDVMAHLRQRNHRSAAAIAPLNPPGSAHSARPRILSFTPQATPRSRLGTPMSRQLVTPLGEQASVGPAVHRRALAPAMPLGELLAEADRDDEEGLDGDTSSSNADPYRNPLYL